MLLSDFNALGTISMPTPPTVALTEFFHADTVASVHPLPVSWYLISSLRVYLCSCMHIMSILCSTADALSSDSWSILFKVLTLNVAICIVCLHFSSFCCLNTVADFSNTEARAPTSVGRAPFFTRAKSGFAKNYQGITLTSIAAKIYNALLRNRIEPKIDNILRKNQNGFRRNRSLTSQILTIRRTLEGLRAKKPTGDNNIILSTLTRPLIPFTGRRGNKFYKHTAYQKRPLQQ